VTKPNTQSIYDIIGSIAESLHQEYGIPLERLQGLLKVVATIAYSELAQSFKSTIEVEVPKSNELLENFEFNLKSLAVALVFSEMMKKMPAPNQVPPLYQENIIGMQKACLRLQGTKEQCEEVLVVLRKVGGNIQIA
jgi:hypothetical protein